MEVKELQSRIEGKVATTTDAGYENLRRELIWNQLTPARYPQLVVQVATEQDVVEAVQFARAKGMKIAVRGGGHNWVGFALRDGSLLIDLGRLNQVSIDREARMATIQPAVGRARIGLSRRALSDGAPKRLFAEWRSGLELEPLGAGLCQRRRRPRRHG
jgi:hypothetical protein